jgi:asparagine synthase (glutamine-hydrolysing)
LAERYLPRAVIYRHKQGFNSALPYLLADEFQHLFHRFLRDSRLVAAGFLRPGPIVRMLNHHVERRRDHGNRLWLLLNAELWYRMHIDGQTPDALREELAAPLDGRIPSTRAVEAVPA